MLDKRLLAYIKGKRYLLVLITVFSFLGLLANVSLTLLLSLSIQRFVEAGNEGWYFLLGGLGAAFLSLVFYTFKSKLSNSLADYVAEKIRDDTYAKYVRLEGHAKYSAQEIAQLSSEGVEQLRLYYSSYLPSFFYAMIAPISLFVLICFFSWKVAILYLACVPLIPVSIIMVSKWAKKIFATYWDRYIALGGAYLDSVSGMKELLIFHYDEAMQEKMKRDSEEFRRITMKVLVMQLFSTTIMDVVAYGGAAVGIMLTLFGLNAGDFSPYIALFLCLIGAEFFLPMRSLGSAFHVAMNGATAGRKVLALLEEEELPQGKETLDVITSIELKNVSFAYPGAEENILNSINMNLKPGFYALIGSSGSGKSTLAKILSKQSFDYQGSILVNGVEISSIRQEDFHRLSYYLASDSFLLHLPLIEAFHYYAPQIKEDEIWTLLERVNLKKRMLDAGGLSYTPKEGASDLSGGEKQRLLLAYYLAAPRDFCLFDETTSNIDKESEAVIVREIKELSKHSIVLFISHRLQNALEADYVYRIGEKGTITEEGTPEVLEKGDNEFAKSLRFEKLEEALA